MKKTLLIIGLIASLANFNLTAQFIDNKIDLKVTSGIALPVGEETVNEENFVTPSLFRGYDNSYYYSVEGMYNYRPNCSLGVTWNKFSFANWSNSDGELFTNSSSEISSLGPFIKLHTKFSQIGFFNKVELFTTLSPYITFIKSNLYQEALFSNEPSIVTNAIIESRYSSFGGSISVGANYSMTQSIDLNLEIGGRYNQLNSQLYNDKSIVLLNFGAGIVFKLVRNRRYYL